jgi:hypothetical protein
MGEILNDRGTDEAGGSGDENARGQNPLKKA